MRLNYLRLRWERGASAERISHELGGITRRSVLGKVRRLGLNRFRRRRAALGRPVRKIRERDLSRERARVTRRPSRTGHPTLMVHRDELDNATVRTLSPADLAHLSPFLFALPGQTVPAWVRDTKPYVDDPDAGVDPAGAAPLASRPRQQGLPLAVRRSCDLRLFLLRRCGAHGQALWRRTLRASVSAREARIPDCACAIRACAGPAAAVANQTGSNGEEPR